MPLFIGFLLTGFLSYANEETGQVKGIVTTRDHKPATSVTIQLKGTRHIVLTHEAAEFPFINNYPAVTPLGVTCFA